MEVYQKTKTRIITEPSNSTPGYISKLKTETLITKDALPQCWQQHYLQNPRYGSNLSAHQR